MASKASKQPPLSLGGLDRQIGYLLRRAQLAGFAHFNEALRSVKLTPGKFSVLLLIHENPGLPQAAICAALDILKSNLVAVIQEFERRGLVQRHRHDHDGRAHELRLTPQGRTLLRKAVRLNDAHEAKLHGHFSLADQERLIRMLKQVATIDPSS